MARTLSTFLNLTEDSIGQIGAGKTKRSGNLDVAVFQSLQRKGEVRDLVADYGQVVVDECHHVSAFTFEQVLKQVKARVDGDTIPQGRSPPDNHYAVRANTLQLERAKGSRNLALRSQGYHPADEFPAATGGDGIIHPGTVCGDDAPA
jgi:hypothetical protein